MTSNDALISVKTEIRDPDAPVSCKPEAASETDTEIKL